MNNITPNSTDSITVIDETQLKQFQSLYYLIKGKRDTDIKLFTDYKQFSYDDIIELNNKIYKKLNLHEVVTDIVNVNVGLNNKEVKSFGNWHEFKSTDWNISSKTRYITIEWDFNLILPNQQHKVPQTHTLKVRMGNSLRPSEMIQVVFQGGEEYEYEEAQSQMSCKIDFINSQICNELKSVVCEWYESLPENSNSHTLIKFVVKHQLKLRGLVIFFYLTACLILVNFLSEIAFNNSNYIFPNNELQKLFALFTTSILFFYTFYNLGRLNVHRMMRKQIDKLERDPMFYFTKGDRNGFKEVKKTNRKLMKGLFLSLIIGLVANALTVIIGQVLKFIFENN